MLGVSNMTTSNKTRMISLELLPWYNLILLTAEPEWLSFITWDYLKWAASLSESLFNPRLVFCHHSHSVRSMIKLYNTETLWPITTLNHLYGDDITSDIVCMLHAKKHFVYIRKAKISWVQLTLVILLKCSRLKPCVTEKFLLCAHWF